MRHDTHTIRFHPPGAGTRSATGVWTPGLDPDAVDVDANVSSPDTSEGPVEADVDCVARVDSLVAVDRRDLVEVVDHPVHTGLYSITRVSGGRWVKRLALHRTSLQDGTDAIGRQ